MINYHSFSLRHEPRDDDGHDEYATCSYGRRWGDRLKVVTVPFFGGSEDAADDDGNEQPHDGQILMEMS